MFFLSKQVFCSASSRFVFRIVLQRSFPCNPRTMSLPQTQQFGSATSWDFGPISRRWLWRLSDAPSCAREVTKESSKVSNLQPGCWEYRRFIGIKTANLLGGWTNPFRKNICLSNWVHLPQFIPIFRVKIKNIWNHQPEIYSNFNISSFLWNFLG